METEIRSLLVHVDSLSLTLDWNDREHSRDMLIEAIDSFARFLINQTQSAGLNFVIIDRSGLGEIVSIERVVLDEITEVEVKLWDQKKKIAKKGEVRLNIDVSGSVVRNGIPSSFSSLSLDDPPPSKPPPPSPAKISPQDLSKAKTPDKLWLAINGKVYDLSQYHESHPGGSHVLLTAAGKDATQAFSNSLHRRCTSLGVG